MQDALRETEDHDLGPAISHFFNCLFGSCQAVATKGAVSITQSRTPKKVFLVDKYICRFLLFHSYILMEEMY